MAKKMKKLGSNKQNMYFPVDNSANIHFAVLTKDRANTYRMTVEIDRSIDPVVLQEAFCAVAPRFPDLIAGVQQGFLKNIIVPADIDLTIIKDRKVLAYMPIVEINRCAFRLLYKNNKVSIEVFHSLTDGYGGMEFLKTLMCEYFIRAGITEPFRSSIVRHIDQSPTCEEYEDSFAIYAGKKKAPVNNISSYLPGGKEPKRDIETTTGEFSAQDIRTIAHQYNVSINTLLTAVMAKSIMELQMFYCNDVDSLKPVQIMVPADLRKIFPSRTLRNFSLYALPKVTKKDFGKDFCQVVYDIEKQIKKDFAKENLEAVMATNMTLDKNFILKNIPASLKNLVLRAGFHAVGKKQSSITLSNLGVMTFPEEISGYIKSFKVYLTPRAASPYNCTVSTYAGRLFVNFTRGSQHPELEPIFFANMQDLGVKAAIEVNDNSVIFEKYLDGAKIPVLSRPVFCYNSYGNYKEESDEQR